MSVYKGLFDSFETMVANFENIYMTKAEYEAEKSPWTNDRMWNENKAKLKQALESETYKNIEILWAEYDMDGYEGSAFVLFRKDGKLYRVDGSHCSCYGLEGQWLPEETSWEVLKETQGKRESYYSAPCKEFGEWLQQQA